MVLNPVHKDDLEAFQEDYEERVLWEKHAIESELRDMEVEDMMENVFQTSEEESSKVVLFAEDGDYGYVQFAGIFDSIDLLLNILKDSDNELTVTEADDDDNVSFYLVDMAPDIPDILFGMKLVERNAFMA